MFKKSLGERKVTFYNKYCLSFAPFYVGLKFLIRRKHYPLFFLELFFGGCCRGLFVVRVTEAAFLIPTTIYLPQNEGEGVNYLFYGTVKNGGRVEVK